MKAVPSSVLVLPFYFRPKKEMGSDSPKPDPYGHLRGLPQSFTRSQKERPLTVVNIQARTQALVAMVLQSGGNSPTFTRGDENARSGRRLQLSRRGFTNPRFCGTTARHLAAQKSSRGFRKSYVATYKGEARARR